MYSEALAIMDRNTIQLTLEAELSYTKEELSDAKEELNDAREQLADNQKTLSEKDNIIAKQLAELEKYKALYGESTTID